MKIIDEYCFFPNLESCLKDDRTYRNREKMSDWEKEYRATVIEAESYEILASDNETLEVIGNIYDNPELVKE